MGLYDAARLFKFEVESSDNLRFIPLAVRFNLDRFGMRITLDSGRCFLTTIASCLPDFPSKKSEIEPNFDHAMEEMLRTHANVEPEKFAPDNPIRSGLTPTPFPRPSSVRAACRRELAEPVAMGETRPLPALRARQALAAHRRTEPRFHARHARIRAGRISASRTPPQESSTIKRFRLFKRRPKLAAALPIQSFADVADDAVLRRRSIASPPSPDGARKSPHLRPLSRMTLVAQ